MNAVDLLTHIFIYIVWYFQYENSTLKLEPSSRSGGPDAKEIVKNSRPWLVFTRKCGGALIGKRTVLTAAHCIWPESVLVGEHDVTVSDGEEKYMVETAVDHPKYGIRSTIQFFLSLKHIRYVVYYFNTYIRIYGHHNNIKIM